MYQTIQITNQDFTGTDYSYSWEGTTLIIQHGLGSDYVAQLLDGENTVVVYPMQIEENEIRVSFPELPEDGESFECRVFSVSEAPSPTPEDEKYYSGPKENILLFCKSLNISDDRLSSIRPQSIEKYQRLVDDAIDGYLTEFYFTPICAYNQVQNDGSVRKVFPGKLRLLAIQWTAGLLLQSEFQNLEPNVNEQARLFVEDAKKEMQQITDFSMRIPGQRRKNPLPTMPPNLAPSKTAEYFL